jgi:hypothetical protein
MFKPGQGILSYLKQVGRGVDLPLDALRPFQEFEKALVAGLESYEGRDPAITYGMQSFTKIEMFGIALMTSDAFPAVRRCHAELMRLFKNDSTFDDGVSLMSWLLFNFPTTQGGVPLAQEIVARTPHLASDIVPFVEEGLRSRLGLYEVQKDGKDECRLKELFTGKAVTLNQSLGGAARGELALGRVMTIGGRNWTFGHAPGFPASRKAIVEDMVEQKMSMYFPDDNATSYETMMRLAGPYWFSIVAHDYRGDILHPDHYLQYYRG